MDKVTLPWMNKIRERLNEKRSWGTKYRDLLMVREFLEPIIEYGESEEERLSKWENSKIAERKSI
jgi:sulfur transfer protein SufE